MTPPAYELVQHPQYGHCAIAARCISAGEIVMDELPALVLPRSDPLASSSHAGAGDETARYRRRRAFMNLPWEAQLALHGACLSAQARKDIFAHYHVPDRAAEPRVGASAAYRRAKRGVLALRKAGSAVFAEIEHVSDKDMLRFVLVVLANAHQLAADGTSALLTAGAKVSHRCRFPNVAASTRGNRSDAANEQGAAIRMRHIALQDIAKGEVLFNSYADVGLLCTQERQKRLLDGKLFDCACSTCESDSAIDTEVADTTLLSEFVAWETSETSASDRVSDAPSWLHRLQQSGLADHHVVVIRCKLELLAARAVVVGDTGEMPDMMESDFDSLDALCVELERWFDDRYRPLGTKSSSQSDILLDRPLLDHYLTLAESLMQRGMLQSSNVEAEEGSGEMSMADFVERSMAMVQDLLLKVRPSIERARGWPIPHALQDDYDDVVQQLNDLVLGQGGSFEE